MVTKRENEEEEDTEPSTPEAIRARRVAPVVPVPWCEDRWAEDLRARLRVAPTPPPFDPSARRSDRGVDIAVLVFAALAIAGSVCAIFDALRAFP